MKTARTQSAKRKAGLNHDQAPRDGNVPSRGGYEASRRARPLALEEVVGI